MNLLRQKRQLEISFWFALLFVMPVLLATTEIMENARGDSDYALWKSFLSEFSSTFVIALLLPLIFAIDRRLPFKERDWFYRILVHLPLSLFFSVLHISGMMAIRSLVYQLNGEVYQFESPLWTFVFEYRKDLVGYMVVVVILYSYRELLRLRLGEAKLGEQSVVSEEDGEPPSNVEQPVTITVEKNGLTSVLPANDVIWVEAAGNYVELHTADDMYMLRSTMKEIETRLGHEQFARIHRSNIVNRRNIARIAPAKNGDKTVVLDNGMSFRFSRRYRQALDL